MSLEARVDVLEVNYSTLDESLHSLVRAVADIKGIVLENRDLLIKHDKKLDQQGKEIAALKSCITALADATYAGFKSTDKKIDQLELLIRQLLPSN